MVKTRRSTFTEVKVRLDPATKAALAQAAAARGETEADYVRRALRLALVWDALGPEADRLTRHIHDAVADVAMAANAAAIHAMAAVDLLAPSPGPQRRARWPAGAGGGIGGGGGGGRGGNAVGEPGVSGAVGLVGGRGHV